MTINERIRYLRKTVLHLNQTDFAKAIGMKQRGASGMEQNGNTVTDRAIKTICLVFNINEAWLRGGIEPMYAQSSTFSLDEFVKQRGGSEMDIEILRTYFDLDPETRAALFKFFKSTVHSSDSSKNLSAEQKNTIQDAEAEYIKSRSNIAQNTGSSASNTIADVIFPANKTDKASNQ